MGNNNEVECSIPGPSTEKNANNLSNSSFKNRPENTLLSNNNDIEYFLPGKSEDSDKKQTLK